MYIEFYFIYMYKFHRLRHVLLVDYKRRLKLEYLKGDNKVTTISLRVHDYGYTLLSYKTSKMSTCIPTCNLLNRWTIKYKFGLVCIWAEMILYVCLFMFSVLAKS